MPNNTVRAADTGLPNLNRRSALAKVGLGIAGSAALASGPVAAAARGGSVSPELLRLIETHRRTWAAVEEASSKFATAEVAYRMHSPPEYAPLSPAGKDYHAGRDHAAIKAQINKSHQFRSDDSWIIKHGSPERLQQYVDLCDAVKDEAVAGVDRFFAQDEEAKRLSGLGVVEHEVSAASAAETNALLMLCEYLCSTPGDEAARLRYLACVEDICDRSDALEALFLAAGD